MFCATFFGYFLGFHPPEVVHVRNVFWATAGGYNTIAIVQSPRQGYECISAF